MGRINKQRSFYSHLRLDFLNELRFFRAQLLLLLLKNETTYHFFSLSLFLVRYVDPRGEFH